MLFCINDNHILLGDLNYDLLSETKSKPLTEIMELFDLKNLITGATCFKKGCTPSQNDVILSNVSARCMKSLNFPTGISDCHNISTVINSKIAKDEMSKFEYRSFRGFDHDKFLSDLQRIDFSFDQSAESDANTVYEQFETKLSNVVNKHIPIKQAYQRKKKLPCMNSALKKAIFLKKKLFKQYENSRNQKSWEKYRIQRNLVTKLKKKSTNTYFQERCLGGSKSENFWKTIKPYLSKKNVNSNTKIILSENNKLITNQKEISKVFNDFFINVADSIGQGISFDSTTHPSIYKIKENNTDEKSFNFSMIDEGQISKHIDKLHVKKATGVDKISSKIIKLGKPALQSPLTDLINLTIQTSTFPENLKRAQLAPLHKKNDPMEKSNFRPVSVLTTISKIYEKVLSEQLSAYFDGIFDQYLCAFRKGHGCQTTLLRLLED